METSTTQNIWNKSKFIIKGLMIAVMVLLLMIPAYFVTELVREREERQLEAVEEVSSKWSSRQIITGPIVVVPYRSYSPDSSSASIKNYAYFLPDQLDINAEINPIEKHRGIYSVMLYNSNSILTGEFKEISPAALKIQEKDIIWNEIFVKIHVSDSRGLNNELVLKWKDSLLTLTQLAIEDGESSRALGANLAARSLDDLQNIHFSTAIALKGSEKILFSPVGKKTVATLHSTWSNPSFTGNSLPDTSDINQEGFTASWTSLSHTRPFSQSWKGNVFRVADIVPESIPIVDTGSNAITSSSFGVNLFIPVNGYQKTMRSVKYAVLFILLTFTAFFLIETSNKRSVHPIQYGLIGFALILFYTLLLSFSEYTGFNLAYGIAAIATIGLIAWFVHGLLGSARLFLLLSFVLVLLYTYVFTILQLQDYALILGSIGLFLMLAVVMKYSRKMQW